MKILKRLLVLAATVIMLCVISVVASAATYGDLYYTVSDAGAVSIYSCSQSVTEVVIPAEIDGKPVLTIESNAFKHCDSLTSVTIPDGVTKIGSSAFYDCDALESVTIPASVAIVGDHAFYLCPSLKSVYIESIESWMEISFLNSLANPLYNKADLYLNGELVTDLIIPDGVKSVNYDAFSGCNSISSVTIPDSVTSIGSYAFYTCDSLESVTIGNGVTSIGILAFSHCKSLESVTLGRSVTSVGDNTFDGSYNIKSVYVDSLETWCNITFGESEQHLISGADLYVNGELLNELVIPEGVTGYCDKFKGCTSITSIKIPESWTSVGDYEFSDFCNLTSITIPDSVTSIGSYAFYNCHSLASITIPDSVTSIGSYAFCNCKSLTNITIPASVTSISDGEFYNCKSLTNITIPASVTSIGEHAFNGCSSLTSITIPETVAHVGCAAFGNCYGLIEVNWNAKNITLCDNWNHDGLYYTLFYDASSQDEAEMDVVFGDAVESIPHSIFCSNSRVKSVSIGKSVKTIGGAAFRNCDNLTKIYWNAASASFMGTEPFYHAGSSGDGIDVVFGDTVKTIPDKLFYVDDEYYENKSGSDYSPKIRSVKMGNSVTYIGEYAFYDCSNMKGELLPDSVTSIGQYAFYNCDSLKSITIPETVKFIGDFAFSGCGGLQKINWNAKNATIGYSTRFGGTDVFPSSGCSIDVVFGDSVEKIPEYLFAAGPNIKSITFSDSIKRIGEAAFVNCKYIEYVVIPANIKSIGRYAFGYTNYNQYLLGRYDLIEGYRIYGYEGTAAESYAKSEDFEFVVLCDEHLNTVVDNQIDPTCASEGYAGDIHCSDCGVVLKGESIPKLPHTDEIIKGYAATCTAKGLTDGTKCSVCGEILTAQEEISATGHTEEILPAVPATYTETGLTEGKKCSVCNEILVAQEVIPILELPTLKPGTDNITVTDTVVKLTPKMKASAFKSGVENENIAILSADGKALADNALVGTGAKVQIKDKDGKVLSEYEVLVKCDVNGDGQITPADARLALRCAAKLEKLSGLYETAANYDDKGIITPSDARMILRKAAGLEK